MHRHRKLVPIVRCAKHTRSAATAAKLKPRDAAEPSTSFSSDLGKWAYPAAEPGQPTETSRSPEAFPSVNSNKWVRPAAQFAQSTATSKPSAAFPSVNSNKWAHPRAQSAQSTAQKVPGIANTTITSSAIRSPPNSQSRTPEDTHEVNQSSPPTRKSWALPPRKNAIPSPISSTPQSSSRSSTKWAQRIPPKPSHSHAMPPTASPSLPPSPPIDSHRRDDRRLQRDMAPHRAQSPMHERGPPHKSQPIMRERSLPPHLQPRNSTLSLSSRDNRHTQPASMQSTPEIREQAHSIPTTELHGKLREGQIPLPNELGQKSSEFGRGSETRNGWSIRAAFKDRGSLLSKINKDSSTSSHIRTDSSSQKQLAKVKKPKKYLEKRPRADVYIPSTVSVGQLSRLLNVRLERLQRKMRMSGMEQEATHDYVLTSDYAVLLAEEFGRNPIVDDEAAFDIYPPPPHPDPSSLPSRPPVVTIMGHVDHGKTTLLDTLRSSSVAKCEAGGITQHIGAFSVPVLAASADAGGPRSITFLDTPGHAAFSAMRARGAGVTDIVVLVVAADDGIMPQTKEVIELIKKDEGKVSLVVTINKVDKPGADIESVERALLTEGIQLETYGGDVPCVRVSGLTGEGLPDLVETLSAMSEMQDLRAEHGGIVYGHVLESKVQKGLGPVATVLVLRGCLEPGSHILSGVSQAKVRLMTDSGGKAVKAAYPGMAITVSGWKTLPKAGDDVIQGKEADVKKALSNRIRQADIEASLADLDAINASRREEREKRDLEKSDLPTENIPVTETGPKELRLIVKADVSGSAEAVEGALQGIGNNQAITKIISSGVGNISESDIMMAKAANATIIGFSVSASRSVEILASQNGVPIYISTIIYRLMEEVQNRVIALLPVIIETKVTGEATVLQLFNIQVKSKITRTVAGCRVINGIVDKSKLARVIRGGVVIHEGSLDTMRQLKKDVTEIRKGSECGLSLAEFADLREGDLIQMYEKVERPGVL